MNYHENVNHTSTRKSCLLFPLAKEEPARGGREGGERGEEMGLDGRFLIFTGSPLLLLQKEEFEVSPASLRGKVGSLPALTVR